MFLGYLTVKGLDSADKLSDLSEAESRLGAPSCVTTSQVAFATVRAKHVLALFYEDFAENDWMDCHCHHSSA